MKYLWILILGGLIALGAWLLIGGDSANRSVSPVTMDSRQQPISPPNKSLAEKLRESQLTQTNLIPNQDQSQLTTQAKAKRDEIEQQIALLNENLKDPSQRKAIQANLKLLLEEYNQMALPLALNQLSEEQ